MDTRDHLLVRKTLDFIIEFINEGSDYFDDIEIVLILRYCMELLDISDFSLRKKIFCIMFLYDVSDGEMPIMTQRRLDMIISAIKLILTDELTHKQPKKFKIL